MYDTQSAVRVIGPRVAGLRNIYYPPGPHYHRGNPSRSGLYGVTSDEVYDHLDENDMGDPDTEGSDASDGEEYGSSSDGSYGFVRQPRAIAVAIDGIFWEIPGCAGVRVRAAQLQHRVPCWGYTFLEAVPYEGCSRRRKVRQYRIVCCVHVEPFLPNLPLTCVSLLPFVATSASAVMCVDSLS